MVIPASITDDAACGLQIGEWYRVCSLLRWSNLTKEYVMNNSNQQNNNQNQSQNESQGFYRENLNSSQSGK